MSNGICTRTWTLGLICVLLIMGLVGHHIYSQRQKILAEARHDTAEIASLVGMDLKRTLDGLDQTLTSLENNLMPGPATKQLDPPAIRRIIDGLVLENPLLQLLMVIDKKGQILHWNNNFQKPDLRQNHFFHIHTIGDFDGLFFGLPQPSPINRDQWTSAISKAIRDRDGSLLMVMAAVIDLKYLDQSYQSMLIHPGSSLTISSLEGHIYAHLPETGKLVGQKLPALAANSSQTIDADQGLSVTRKIGGYPLQVTIAMERSAVLAFWQSSSLRFFALGGLLSVIVLFMSYRTARHQRHQLAIKERLEQVTGIDSLTRLLDRNRILEQARLEIKKALRHNLPVSIILLDLQQSRDFSDHYDHDLRDDIVKDTAGVVRQCKRETDLAGHLGRGEFLLLLPHTNIQGATILGRKIHENLRQRPEFQPGGKIHLAAGLGVAQWAAGEEDITPALMRAQAILSQAWQGGLNQIKWIPNSHHDQGEEGDGAVCLYPRTGGV